MVEKGFGGRGGEGVQVGEGGERAESEVADGVGWVVEEESRKALG